MSLVALGIAATGLLGAWLFGGLVLRLGGAVVALAGLAGLALSGDTKGVLVLLIGGLLWLAGHWHYALRHHAYKSPLARYMFCRWVPVWLDPTRGWALATVADSADRDVAGGGEGPGELSAEPEGSGAAVAAWLGTLRLDRPELEQGPRGRPTAVDVAHLAPDVRAAVTRSLAEALIERAGLDRDAEGRWLAGDGRRTSAISEALTWALVAIAEDG